MTDAAKQGEKGREKKLPSVLSKRRCLFSFLSRRLFPFAEQRLILVLVQTPLRNDAFTFIYPSLNIQVYYICTRKYLQGSPRSHALAHTPTILLYSLNYTILFFSFFFFILFPRRTFPLRTRGRTAYHTLPPTRYILVCVYIYIYQHSPNIFHVVRQYIVYCTTVYVSKG